MRVKRWDRMELEGITPELGPVRRHGVRGSMMSVYLRDPDGNLVEICSYRDRAVSEEAAAQD